MSSEPPSIRAGVRATSHPPQSSGHPRASICEAARRGARVTSMPVLPTPQQTPRSQLLFKAGAAGRLGQPCNLAGACESWQTGTLISQGTAGPEGQPDLARPSILTPSSAVDGFWLTPNHSLDKSPDGGRLAVDKEGAHHTHYTAGKTGAGKGSQVSPGSGRVPPDAALSQGTAHLSGHQNHLFKHQLLDPHPELLSPRG